MKIKFYHSEAINIVYILITSYHLEPYSIIRGSFWMHRQREIYRKGMRERESIVILYLNVTRGKTFIFLSLYVRKGFLCGIVHVQYTNKFLEGNRSKRANLSLIYSKTLQTWNGNTWPCVIHYVCANKFICFSLTKMISDFSSALRRRLLWT